MRTKVILAVAALAASFTASAAVAKDSVTIDRLGGREVEIITASARDTASGLRVFGLIRRASIGRRRPAPPAHESLSAPSYLRTLPTASHAQKPSWGHAWSRLQMPTRTRVWGSVVGVLGRGQNRGPGQKILASRQSPLI